MLEEKKYFLTKDGLKKIKREYKKLLKSRKLKSKIDVPPVLHSDELNAEFVSYKEDIDLLEARITELDYILKKFELIKPPPKKERDRVHLGAQVQVEVDGQTDEFTIVGTLEANPTAGKISNECPVGKALLGRKIGEEVAVSSEVKTVYKIKQVRYKNI